MNLTEIILKHGIENILFMAPVSPLHHFMGISYTTNDGKFMMPCVIDEKRYKVSENYKIVLKPVHYPSFATEHYYVDDLKQMIKRGDIQMFIKTKLEN
jgi:hypothetical protein